MIETQQYERNPFHVDAVQVSGENMEEAADWCEGDIHDVESAGEKTGQQFIKVLVHRPLTERQTKAFVGGLASLRWLGLQGLHR